MNSPETPLFHKGDNLYNLAAARLATHNGAALVVVEGYVDVIAMVGAGFPASVAPLGTALTENQLVLLWKMADEPILCFDGDKAGQKAAWRAAELALPLSGARQEPAFRAAAGGPGPRRSRPLRRPRRDRGSDWRGARPRRRDLVARDRGRHALPRPSGAPRWRRGSSELTNGIRDEVVRRYYRQDLAERLQRTFAPEGGRGGYGRGNFRGGAGGFGGESGRRFAPAQPPSRRAPRAESSRAAGARPRPAARPSTAGPTRRRARSLPLSPIMRGQRSAISRREALILQSLINHPWLLHDHLEEVAALEMAHPEANKLRAAIIAAFASDHHHSPEPEEQAEKMRADLAARGFSEVLQRVERAITTQAVWGVQVGAAREDVLSTWHQLVSLHRQWHSLLRELKDAEQALGDEASEANLAWLRDIKARLEEVDGTEALIEGFGDFSGPVAAGRLIEK